MLSPKAVPVGCGAGVRARRPPAHAAFKSTQSLQRKQFSASAAAAAPCVGSVLHGRLRGRDRLRKRAAAPGRPRLHGGADAGLACPGGSVTGVRATARVRRRRRRGGDPFRAGGRARQRGVTSYCSIGCSPWPRAAACARREASSADAADVKPIITDTREGGEGAAGQAARARAGRVRPGPAGAGRGAGRGWPDPARRSDDPGSGRARRSCRRSAASASARVSGASPLPDLEGTHRVGPGPGGCVSCPFLPVPALPRRQADRRARPVKAAVRHYRIQPRGG